MVYDNEKLDDVNEIHKLMKEFASFISKKMHILLLPMILLLKRM